MNPLVFSQMALLETRLRQLVQSEVEFIELIGEDLLDAGGKRARPQLVFLVAKALGSSDSRLVDYAAVIELLHSASLLHDDLIDDADTRRGKETAFKHYGNVVSVMSGDYLLAKLMIVLSDFGTLTPDFVRLVGNTSRTICEGEVLQFQVAALGTYNLPNYFSIITGKTASLVAAATKGAALLAGAAPDVVQALETFGLEYGRAFQIQDDILDLMSDEQTIGKPIGGDLREGKATLPVLYLLEREISEARAILERRATQIGDIERMRALVLQHGTDQEARSEMRRRAQNAVQALAVLPNSPAKSALEALAMREAERVA
ncbi:MAG: polyprenyl synthetase family protein [Deinococcales bacterium]